MPGGHELSLTMLTNGNRQQQLEQEVRDLKERLRTLEPQDSPTVRHEKTAHGVISHADPAAPAPEPEPALYWL